MKLRTTQPPEDCYVYTTPFNTDSQQHWEFFIKTPLVNPCILTTVAYIHLEIKAFNCDGTTFTYFDDVPSDLLLNTGTRHHVGYVSSNLWVLFKKFNYTYGGKHYLRFRLTFDCDYIDLYSEWLEQESCTGTVTTILPCIQDGKVVDINNDFVGLMPTMTHVHFNSLILKYYSPQMYLRLATMFFSANNYDLRKINNKVLKTTLKKVWDLDSEWIQENAFAMLHSVFGFGKVWFKSPRETKIFVLETFDTELQDIKALHKYHKVKFTSKEEVEFGYLCSSDCYVAPIEA